MWTPTRLGVALATCMVALSAAADPNPNGGPDVFGLRLGMVPEEAYASMKKRYPKSEIRTSMYNLAPFLPAEKLVLDAYFFGYGEVGIPRDRIVVHFTPPPGKQVAWRIRRQLSRQQIYHANVIASLREKYGKESAAFSGSGGSGERTTDDDQTGQMFWILDAQGRPAPLPPGPANNLLYTLQTCAEELTDTRDEPGHVPFTPGDVANTSAPFDVAHRVDAWCNSSGIILRAMFGMDAIVRELLVEAVDIPMAMRAAREEGEWLRSIADRRQQQEIEASKRAKPSL